MSPESTPKMTESSELRPVTVAVVGTGRAVAGPNPIESGTIAKTPSPHQPNLIVKIVSPLMAIVIRFGHSYLTALLGLVIAGMTTNIIPFTDFVDLLQKSATLSFAGPIVSLIKDFITIFARLENKYPLMTGNV